MMFVYAITNHKGGVGKTTTAINLGAALQLTGKRVLLIDLDPQASLTACLGPSANHVSIEDALFQPSHISRALYPCAQEMTMIPASATLALALADLTHTK